MSFDDWDVVAEAKSPCSMSAVDTPRRARSRATPAPAMPPPMTTTSYSASSSGQGRLFIRSTALAKVWDGAPGGHQSPAQGIEHDARREPQADRQPGLVHLELRRVMRTRGSGRGRDADLEVAARPGLQEQAHVVASHHEALARHRVGAQLVDHARPHQRGLALVIDDGGAPLAHETQRRFGAVGTGDVARIGAEALLHLLAHDWAEGSQ